MPKYPSGLPRQQTYQAQRVARAVADLARTIRRTPFSDGSGRLVENAKIEAWGYADVMHALGYVPRGVDVVGVRLTAVVANPAPFEVCRDDGQAMHRTKSCVRFHNPSASTMFVDLWVY